MDHSSLWIQTKGLGIEFIGTLRSETPNSGSKQLFLPKNCHRRQFLSNCSGSKQLFVLRKLSYCSFLSQFYWLLTLKTDGPPAP